MVVIIIIDPMSTVSVLATTTSCGDVGDSGDDDDNGGRSTADGAAVLGVACFTCGGGAKSAALVLGSLTCSGSANVVNGGVEVLWLWWW
jgi:hypothetical protein